jgi:hypothetical protein
MLRFYSKIKQISMREQAEREKADKEQREKESEDESHISRDERSPPSLHKISASTVPGLPSPSRKLFINTETNFRSKPILIKNET